METKKIYKKRNCWRNIKGNWYYRLNIWDGKQNVEWIIPFKEKDKKVANRLYIRYLKPIIPDIRLGVYQKHHLK